MPSPRYHGLILAGGRGTRFWPRSRRLRPKQLLPFLSERSLLQETVERLRPVIPPERLWILTNEALRREVRRQLPDVPLRQILAEPAARNTAPAIGLAAQVVHSVDPEAVLGVFPSDHYIARPSLYRRVLERALRAAAGGGLGVMGIAPRWPETGYGYIEFPKGTVAGSLDPVPVRRFREKPDLKTAKRFLADGRFYWNAGMFFWRADVILEELRRHLPKTASLLASLPRFGQRGFGDALAAAFPKAEEISIDYAVLEKAANVFGIPAPEIGWNDLGSWNAVYELISEINGANVSTADLLAIDSAGNYVNARGKLVALLGVRDLVVVDTEDAILVADRGQAQRVGEIVRRLAAGDQKHLV
jgi:mannose-1-phosphate guanylyltransferase